MSLRRSTRTKTAPDVAETQEHTEAAPANTSKKRVRTSPVSVAHLNEAEGNAQADAVAMPPPSTPAKRRRIESKPPPLTPTPSAIGMMIEPRSRRSRSDSDAQDTASRPVDPHQTNATLVTPGGTQVTRDDDNDDNDVSPSRPSALPTTSTLLTAAYDHFVTVDPTLKPLLDRHYCKVFSEEGLGEEINPFSSLVSAILSQQVSGAAAKSIKNKFIALYTPEQCPDGFPLPSAVAATEIPRLRTAGLSQRKAEYVQGLAEKFDNGELTVEMLIHGSDETVMEKLVAVRGLGAWSVEMFMCFALKRTDIFSTGDLGVQRGMAVYAGKDVAKLKSKGGGKWKYMSEQDMLSMSEKFKPYRSMFMWYMWRIEDVDTVALEN